MQQPPPSATDNYDVLNVTAPPYNAVGNGVANDTAAFQAAMDAGKPVYVPPGTYRIQATLTNTAPAQLFGPFSPVLGGTDGAMLVRAFSGHLFDIRGPMLMSNLLLDDDGAGSSARSGAALYLAANYDGGGNVVNNEAPSGSYFSNVRITSTNGDAHAWQYCVHADGSGGYAGGTAPPLRRVMFLHCQFFTGRTPSKTVWLDRVAHFAIVGGLINQGGATAVGGFTVSDAATADVHFTGHEVIGNGVVADSCEGFSFVGGRLGFSTVTTSLTIAAGTLGWVSSLILGEVTNNAPNTCGVLYMNPVRNVARLDNELHVESSRANYLVLAGNNVGNAPYVWVDGDDANVQLQLRSKGAGGVAVNTTTGSGTGGFMVGDASGVSTFIVLPTGVINKLNNLTTQITAFNGNPNGNVVGSLGAICLNTAGGAGVSFYVKESGSGTNTGWVAK